MKSASKAASNAFASEVKAILRDAHAAAEVAVAEFERTAKRGPEGHIADACGGATIIVLKPSYRLRETLKTLGEIEKGGGGAWYLSTFGIGIASQSVTAHEKACEAACTVLRQRLPDDGTFHTQTYLS